MPTLAEQFLTHAAGLPEGAGVSAKALLHLSSQAALNRALARLARNGALLRVARGIYVLPVRSRFGTRAPDVAKILRAWASERGETVAAHGAAAAHALGMTTQVPVRQVFLTSGRSRKLRVGAQTVELRHAPPWQLLHPGQAAGDAIRALAWMGPAGSRTTTSHLKCKLSAAELHAIWTARIRLPAWLAAVVDVLAAPGYEADDGPLTAAQVEQIRKRVAQRNR